MGSGIRLTAADGHELGAYHAEHGFGLARRPIMAFYREALR